MNTPIRHTLILILLVFSHIVISGPVSELKDDESVVFFKTSAWLNQQTNQWHVPIHGWIFEHEDSTVRKGLIAAAMDTGYELKVTAKTKSNFNQRVNWLLVDNERRKSMVIRLAGRTYAIPDSEANGHFSTVLTIDSEILNAAGIESQLSYQAVLSDLDQREFNGLVQLVDPAGLSIISDIDDTIKISEVTDRKQLLDHTFFKDFTAVPGMATLYQKLLQNEGALHFVSSSPWQLYPELEKFISKAQFPDADYALKSFRFKDSSLMNLFASSLETKPPQIIEIIKRYPNRKFILVGDSGEKDPEVYAQIQQQFPLQVIKIWIRNVTNENSSNQRFKTLFNHLNPNQWQLFTDATELNIATGAIESPAN